MSTCNNTVPARSGSERNDTGVSAWGRPESPASAPPGPSALASPVREKRACGRPSRIQPCGDGMRASRCRWRPGQPTDPARSDHAAGTHRDAEVRHQRPGAVEQQSQTSTRSRRLTGHPGNHRHLPSRLFTRCCGGGRSFEHTATGVGRPAHGWGRQRADHPQQFMGLMPIEGELELKPRVSARRIRSIRSVLSPKEPRRTTRANRGHIPASPPAIAAAAAADAADSRPPDPRHPRTRHGPDSA